MKCGQILLDHFAILAKRRLEDAIQKINQPVEVIYRCFELDPSMGRDVKENMYEMLARKYGMSIEQAKANTQNVVQMAKEVGLDYQMDTLILTNTFDAHRLTMYAKTTRFNERDDGTNFTCLFYRIQAYW